jgi:deazaflavin-dependent oxidoreductase (nitroreductase family)
VSAVVGAVVPTDASRGTTGRDQLEAPACLADAVAVDSTAEGLSEAQEVVPVPMPRWWTQINKRVFNPAELRRGTRPVLTHVGRSSGVAYRTPLDAHPVEGGYVFILVYGSQSDWVRNTMAAGHARLTLGEHDIELTAPRLISGHEAWQAIGEGVKRPPGFLRINEYLRMDLANR